MKRAACLTPVLLLLATYAGTQGTTQYENMYGTPVDVAIADIVQGGLFYSNRAVKVRGYIEQLNNGSMRGTYALKDHFNNAVAVVPLPEIAQEFDSEVHFRVGREIRVTGIVQELSTSGDTAGVDPQYGIQFWKYEVPPDPNDERMAKAKRISIHDLNVAPGRYDGSTIRVAGSFRGHNLFQDLPARSERGRSDWVLAEDDQALWVVGHKPRGPGWSLDPDMKRDTGKWLEIVGRPETKAGITYMHVEALSIVPPPAKNLQAAATPTPPPPPKKPPVVVFALPLDGETEVPGDTRFVVQFSKDMDESTFKGRVELRYLGAPRAGVRPLDSVSFTYDGGRRALSVDPGDRLYRGAQLELRLLPGIKDIDGLDLVPRGAYGPQAVAAAPEDAQVTDTLHFRIGT